MIITAGLFDHMVVQRTARGVSDAHVEGTCSATGAVVARVRAKGRAVRGLDGARVGDARRGRFSGRLRGLAAGGPYEVELAIAGSDERVVARDVLVGDVRLLGGQSNMQGCGLLAEACAPDPLVRAFYMDDAWRVARDPIHNMDAAVDEIHAILNGGARPPANTVTGTGPGVGFGREMRRRTGVPQGLVACGHGGTSMAQWDPRQKKLGTRSLYGALVRRLMKNGGAVSGLVWYQGESDANPDAARVYAQNMIAFVRALRRDCRDAKLSVAIVQISRVVNWSADAARPWNNIQEQERLLPRRIAHLAVVPAIDLTLADGIHISGRDQNRLGVRLAQAMDVLRRGRAAGLPPIELGCRTAPQPERADLGMVVIEFENVATALRAAGRPVGFALGDGSSAPGNVFDVRLDGTRALVYATVGLAGLPGLSLQYGPGTDPTCNVTDAADRSLPVFGPVPLGTPKARTPFWRSPDVALLARPPGSIGRTVPTGLSWRRHEYPADFLDSRFVFPRWPKDDTTILYRFRFSCAEAMKLELLLGYDGPVLAWVDGRKVYDDPAGTNPAIADHHVVAFAARRGAHEIVVALGSQSGRAWGIWMRLARRDVPRAAVVSGMPIVMPTATA